MRERGQDLRVIADERAYEGLADELLIELASTDNRILITRSSRHFAPICRTWAEAGREHAGVILIWMLSHRQFGEIVQGVERWLDATSDPAGWRGIVVSI